MSPNTRPSILGQSPSPWRKAARTLQPADSRSSDARALEAMLWTALVEVRSRPEMRRYRKVLDAFGAASAGLIEALGHERGEPSTAPDSAALILAAEAGTVAARGLELDPGSLLERAARGWIRIGSFHLATVHEEPLALQRIEGLQDVALLQGGLIRADLDGPVIGLPSARVPGMDSDAIALEEARTGGLSLYRPGPPTPRPAMTIEVCRPTPLGRASGGTLRARGVRARRLTFIHGDCERAVALLLEDPAADTPE